jgi:hypothetical protein
MRQLGLAVGLYADDNGDEFPPWFDLDQRLAAAALQLLLCPQSSARLPSESVMRKASLLRQ